MGDVVYTPPKGVESGFKEGLAAQSCIQKRAPVENVMVREFIIIVANIWRVFSQVHEDLLEDVYIKSTIS